MQPAMNINKRDRIIALSVCSIIFIVVLIISIVTASRGSRQEKPSKPMQTGTEQAPETPIPPPQEEPATPEPPDPVRPAYRYKHSGVPAVYSEFDYSKRKQLPPHLRNQRMRAGILVDLETRQVIWEKTSRRPVPIASITKLLTLYTAFEELEKRPEISIFTPVTVSRECTLERPVKAPLEPGEKYKLHELFVFSMLKSANDASYLIAEFFGYGEHSKFIEMMNSKALEIGMRTSRFVNANGLPIYRHDNDLNPRMNKASCHDVARLVERVFEYPLIQRYAMTRRAPTRKGIINNGNQLLGRVQGMEGMKTGYTNAAGHCLAFSCKRNGRRIIGVVTGFNKRSDCFKFTEQLLEWGFKN